MKRSFLNITAVIGLLVFPSMREIQAQFLPFGRNKISYAQFHWRVLKTEHFDVYYYPEMLDLAQRGATFAEEAYGDLREKFNFSINHRIPLILYSSPIHFQQTNVSPGFIPEGVGGFFEFLKGRVVIPSNGSLANFRHVIRHELVHVFMHNRVERVIVDYGIPGDRYPPLWFVEGLAEFFSTEWDSQAEMVLRDAVLNGYFTPISRIGAIAGTFLMYKEGQAALMFMAEKYGHESIRLLLENLWKGKTFNDVMKATIGKTFREFDVEWEYYLKKKYYPLLADYREPGDVSIPVVTNGFNSKPTFYQRGDSTYVVYIGNLTGYTSIYMKSLRGGKPVRLIQGEKTDEFEAFHIFQSRMSIYGDSVLVFVTKSGASDVLHLYDLPNRKHLRNLRFKDLVMLGSPSWSPDGTRIVFSAINKAGWNDLYIVNVRTEELRKITNDIYDDRDPAWSPDGSWIVFTSDRGSAGTHGVYNLYGYDLSTRLVYAVTDENTSYYSPAWSADGKTLACTNDRDGTQNIFFFRFDNNRRPVELRRVTRLTTAAFDPVFTAKGSVLFSVFDHFQFQIRGINEVLEAYDSLEVIPFAAPHRPLTAWDVPPYGVQSASSDMPYKRRYQLDLAQSQISTDPVFGTIGGAALSMSDVLGNDQYYFLLYNTAQTADEILSSFSIAVSRISLNTRTPYAYGVYHYSGRRYDLTDPDVYFYERAFGGYFALSYPLSKFYRIEASVKLGNSDKSAIFDVRERKAVLLTNSVSFVKDNALYYWTGPIDGNRFNITLSYTTDIQYSNVNYYSVLLDYRRYFRIDQRTAFASRIELLYNHGEEARRYFLGGSWDLRGWPFWSIRGTKVWLTSHELRFPLLDNIGLNFPFGNVSLGLIRGALFFDAGNAWDAEYPGTRGSIGFGFRFNLLGVLVLRYDLGKRIENNFTSLQSGLFQQFFFGWDF